jgi:hypothetical protein
LENSGKVILPALLESGINRVLHIHGIEEAERAESETPEFSIHHRIQAMVRTRDHITFTLAAVIDQR